MTVQELVVDHIKEILSELSPGDVKYEYIDNYGSYTIYVFPSDSIIFLGNYKKETGIWDCYYFSKDIEIFEAILNGNSSLRISIVQELKNIVTREKTTTEEIMEKNYIRKILLKLL